MVGGGPHHSASDDMARMSTVPHQSFIPFLLGFEKANSTDRTVAYAVYGGVAGQIEGC
jgi:hypothetical protein